MVPRSSFPDSLTKRRLGLAGSIKERREKTGGGGGVGIAVNPSGTKVICFSRFFYAFLCLCCLQTRVRVLCFVCVGSWSFGVGIALRLSYWILDYVRKVLTSFEIFSQPAGLVGKRTSRFIRFGFSER